MDEGAPKTKNQREHVDHLVAYVNSFSDISQDYKDKLMKIIQMSRGVHIADSEIKKLIDGVIGLIKKENEKEMSLDSLLDPEELIEIYSDIDDLVRTEENRETAERDLNSVLSQKIN